MEQNEINSGDIKTVVQQTTLQKKSENSMKASFASTGTYKNNKRRIYLSHIHYSKIIFFTSKLVSKLESKRKASHYTTPLEQKGLENLLKGPPLVVRSGWGL